MGRTAVRGGALAALVPLVVGALFVGRTAVGSSPSAGVPSAPSAPGTTQAPFDATSVVDAIRHRFEPSPHGTLDVEDDAYRASLGADGLRVHLDGGTVGLGLDGAGPSWTGQGNVRSRSVAPGITERVTARSGEVEWDVVLDRRPAGDGSFVVDARLDGVRSAERAGDQWRLEVDGGATARMGEVVVLDASGREMQRSLPLIDAGRVRLEVPADVLAAARYPLTIDPVLGPEVPVSSPSGQPWGQFEPAVSFDGTNYLVVWRDSRIGGSSTPVERIQGARVSTAGELIDREPILIGNGGTGIGSFFQRPDVAFDGTNHVVVWEDTNDGAIRLGRVSPAGDRLDSLDGVAVTASLDPDAAAPGIAMSGATALITWESRTATATTDIVGRRYSGATPLDSSAFPISTAAGDQSLPSVAGSASGFFVAWADRRTSSTPDIFGTNVSPAAVVANPAGLPIAVATGNQDNPDVAAGGGNFLVTWHDDRTGSFDIRGARVSGAGVVLDATPLAISTATGNQSLPSVAFDGTRFLVVWRDRRSGTTLDIYGTRVATDGTVQDPGGVAVSTARKDQSAPAVAGGSGAFFAAWEDHRLGDPEPTGYVDIWGTRLSGAAAVLDPTGLLVSAGNDILPRPAVAFDGTNHLVSWRENRSGDGEIWAARVGPDGGVLDPNGIRVFTNFPHRPWTEPSIAFDGTNFLVAWSTLSGDNVGQPRAARISTGGVVLDTTPIALDGQSAPAPAVASDGNGFLVVWRELDPFSGRIRGQRITAAGAKVPGVIIISDEEQDNSPQEPPTVSFGGGTFLVGWTFQFDGPSTIRTARVSPTGVVNRSTFAPSGSNPAVAWGGGNFLLVWQQQRGGASGFDIRGTRIDAAGTVLDTSGLAVSDEPGNQREPRVAANGPWLVAWLDERSGVQSPSIYAARVATDGTVNDPDGIRIAEAFRGGPSVASAAGDDWAVAYDRLDGTIPGTRIFLRTVSPK